MRTLNWIFLCWALIFIFKPVIVYDCCSRSIKAEEKRDGGGQYNWGKATDVRSVASFSLAECFFEYFLAKSQVVLPILTLISPSWPFLILTFPVVKYQIISFCY